MLRLLTWLIHIDADITGPGDVDAGGVRIHHYVRGIPLLALVGFLGLGDRRPRVRTAVGLGDGAGLALVVDEAALLVGLEDVYRDTSGWVGVGLAVLRSGWPAAPSRSPGPHAKPRPAAADPAGLAM